LPTIGFIYPDHAAEDDYALAQQLIGDDYALPVEHLHGTGPLDLGDPARLAEGALLLAKHKPDAVVWACTSGSFVHGWDGAREQAEKLESAAGVPASSTSLAFVHAARALGLQRVSVAANYPGDVTELFVDFLGAAGLEVLPTSSARSTTEVGELSPEGVVELALSHDHPDAQAVLVPDTALRTLAELNLLEERLGKPVLTANQVTVWEGLRLVGETRLVRTLGALFRRRSA
jgi:maleate cis-trans isomerase